MCLSIPGMLISTQLPFREEIMLNIIFEIYNYFKYRQGTPRRDKTQHDATRHDTTGTRRTTTRHDATRHDATRHDAGSGRTFFVGSYHDQL